MEEKNNQIFQGLVLALLIFVALFLIFQNFLPFSNSSSKERIISVSSNDLNNKNTISVNGFFSEEVQPDQAELYITIRTDTKNAQDAQTYNSETSNKVFKALKDNGIKDKDIETINYRVELIEEWDQESQKTIRKGVRAVNSIKVTLTDLQNTGKILDSAASVEPSAKTIVEVDNIQFVLSQEKQRKVNEDLLAKASENARKKADAISKSLGISIVEVNSVSESNVYIPAPYYQQLSMAEADSGAAKISTPINPSEVTATASVNVIFKFA